MLCRQIVSLVAQCILAGLVVTFVTCEETGRVAFFLWVCGMFLTMCGFLTMVPTLVLAVFGSHHFNVNMGLMETSGVSDVIGYPTYWGWGGGGVGVRVSSLRITSGRITRSEFFSSSSKHKSLNRKSKHKKVQTNAYLF